MPNAVVNARLAPKGNVNLVAKQASGWAKIDPLIAAPIALIEQLGPRNRSPL
jgi:phage terminase large subunit-like protein